MKQFNKAMITTVVGIMLSISLFAGGTISIDGEMAENGIVEIELDCDQDLSLLSFTLQFDSDTAIDSTEIEMNEARFPWNTRGVLTSVDEDQRTLTFTVADLFGQNVMVFKGEGLLFTVPFSGNEKELTVTNVQALSQQGKVVELAVRKE